MPMNGSLPAELLGPSPGLLTPFGRTSLVARVWVVSRSLLLHLTISAVSGVMPPRSARLDPLCSELTSRDCHTPSIVTVTPPP